MTLSIFESLNIALRPAGTAENKHDNYFRHPPFPPIKRNIRPTILARVLIDEDLLYPNTSFYIFQEKSVKKTKN